MIRKLPEHTTYAASIPPAPILKGIGEVCAEHSVLELVVQQTLCDTLRIDYGLGRLSLPEGIVEQFDITKRLWRFWDFKPSTPTKSLRLAKHSPYHDQLKTILKKKTSADVLLKKSVFPILIGYNSSACSSFDAVTQQFIDALTIEIKKIQKLFDKRIAGLHLRFNLILVPMNTKKFVVTEFDRLYLAERRRR